MAFNTSIDTAFKVSVRLGDIINSQITNITTARKLDQSLKEAQFQQTVIDQGLSYDAQLDFRKTQLADAKSAQGVQDNEYISSIEDNISNLRKLVRFQKIRNDYLSNYELLKNGQESLSDHLNFLQSQFNSVTDEDARTQIQDEISSVKQQIATASNNTVQNRVLLAQKDGTVSVLNSAIQDVATKKAQADLVGDTETSSAWDTSLTALKKQLNETNIQNTSHDLDLQITSQGITNPVDKLNKLNSLISSSDKTTPITVAGNNYNSAAEYWTSQRDNYILGTGTDKNFQDFMNDIQGAYKDKIDTLSKLTPFGSVPFSTFQNIQSDYNSLMNKPELINVKDKLATSQTAVLSYGVDKAVTALTQSAVDNLTPNSGVAALDSLQKLTGIDLSTEKSNLELKVAERGSQLPAIDAASQVVTNKSGETPMSTREIATPSEMTNANTPTSTNTAVTTATKPLVTQPTTTNPTTTTTPVTTTNPTTTTTPVTTTNPTTTTTPVTPNYTDYVIKQGDTLSGIAKTQLGDATKFKDIASFNNIADPNKIITGNKIKIPKL